MYQGDREDTHLWHLSSLEGTTALLRIPRKFCVEKYEQFQPSRRQQNDILTDTETLREFATNTVEEVAEQVLN